MERKLQKIIPILALVLIAFILVGSVITVVPTGYTGVRTTFGQISEENVAQGINFKIPLVQQINLVNNKQQDVLIDSKIWAETSEKTPVFAQNITVTYQVNSEKSSWLYRNVTSIKNLVDESVVASAFKSASVTFTANEVTNRENIESKTKEKLIASLDEKYGKDTIVIKKVVIDNMDFEDSYNQAIAAKSNALKDQETKEIQNQTNIAKAEADKKVAIAEAEAKAESIKIEAEAQAEANKILNNSLNDKVLKSKYYDIQSKFYDKWNGKLPSVMGQGTVITDIAGIDDSDTTK